ncbi:uncharacterized protein LOC109706234 [Ananas comosus]|uniref:Uncharacterized protein LOC109706234 n=2 Tax=Ananas comosus TaxID=4615 RepID=A0A6P5EMN7_ANACO|nr:uncharacterized protein LOC109706234 [Ananas comosus]
MGAKENAEERDDRLSDMEKEAKQGKDVESDYEPARDSLSSQGEMQSNEETKVKRASRVPKKLAKKESTDSYPRASRVSSNRQGGSKLQYKTSNNTRKKSEKPDKPASASTNTKNLDSKKSESVKVPSRPSSDVSEETDDKTDDKTIEEVKEIDVDEAPNCDQSVGTDDETIDTEENVMDDDKESAYQKIEEMELRIEKLEQELREVAALEVSLYSVVPEHGSSAHKVHTPARRLSRLYIHACKYWSPDKKATVAKNTASGLVLIAKSCGNDVSRLTFWLSNTVVLREIISQTFGNLLQSNPVLKAVESNGNAKKFDGKSTPSRWKNSSGSKQAKKFTAMQLADDWQETGTFTVALEKIESWIFSRIVESVWWQALTPHMQSPVEDLYTTKSFGKVLGPALGDQQQGSFSINLWKSAFHDAFTKICPLRAGGHECGCLPVLARMVMEQCVARLDVAMFNAILRESESEIPTDPVSDPIVDPKVLPIPAGDLSFGSGAQLKNSIGNWSRWLTDLFGMDDDDPRIDGQIAEEYDDRRLSSESKSFHLLNELSDLLMLPKDMLLERTIRKEVCPSIGSSLVTRILCNFTPDEFCPDPVPGLVLEELNSESMLERLSDKDQISSFPRSAAPITYQPPSPSDVAEKVADAGGKAELDRRASMVQRRGYTSDDDLDDLDSPLTSIIDKTPPVSPSFGNMADATQKERSQANARYKLLREVWSG